MQENRWRPYFILLEQYIHRHNPEWVQEQLHIAKGTYYGEQQRALEALIDYLQQWETDQAVHANGAPAGSAPDDSLAAPLIMPSRPVYPWGGREALLEEI